MERELREKAEESKDYTHQVRLMQVRQLVVAAISLKEWEIEKAVKGKSHRGKTPKRAGATPLFGL